MGNPVRDELVRDIVKSVRMHRQAADSLAKAAEDLSIKESQVFTQILERCAMEIEAHRRRGELIRDFFDRCFKGSSDHKK